MKRITKINDFHIYIFTVIMIFSLSCHPGINPPAFPSFPIFTDRLLSILANNPWNDSTEFGTGFFISPDGYILTAGHVIYDKKMKLYRENFRGRYRIGNSEQTFSLDVIHNFLLDEKPYDVALLKTSEHNKIVNAPYFHLSQDTGGRGDQVIIGGYPKLYRRIPKLPFYRTGVISSLWAFNGTPAYMLDLPVMGGFSGSPVVNLSTDSLYVIGIIRAYPEKRDFDLSIADIIPYEEIQNKIAEHEAD